MSARSIARTWPWAFTIIAPAPARKYWAGFATPLMLSVRQRVEQDVDAERVAWDTELIEEPRVVALALPRVADIRVVRHQHHHASGLVGDDARVRRRAVRALLRRVAARSHEVADIRNLRHLPHRELRR